MTDTPAEPDWSLLPHSPLRFFGLAAGCDQRELKQRYNELIRRFKPERFPEEFQRIRAAYEQLETAIRYGQSTEAAGTPKESVEWAELPSRAQPGSSQQGRDAGFSARRPLHEQVRTGDIGAIYREMEARHIKTPYDYYALAVMSDVVGEGSKFTDWILKGLVAYPNEIGLCRLLHAYFSNLADSETCEAMLLSCAKIVREDVFYPLTEPLWKRLLRTKDFARFRSALEQAEANFKGIQIDSRLAFYLQILKPAVWLADAEWIDNAYALIDQNYERIPKALDYDVEILSRLRAYIKVREQFIRGNAFRRQLDQALCDYFSQDQLTADQSVLACQSAVFEETDRLADAFGEFGDETYGLFYAVWVWVTFDVAQRNIERPRDTLDERIWHTRTLELVARLESKSNWSRFGIKWGLQYVAMICAMAGGFLACVVGGSLLGIMIVIAYADVQGYSRRADDALPIAGLLGGAVGILLGIYLWKWLNNRFVKKFENRMIVTCYRQIWQDGFFKFLAQSHLSYQTLNTYVQSIRNKFDVFPQ